MEILLSDGKNKLELPDDTNEASKELSLFWAEQPQHKFFHMARAIDQLFNASMPDCFMWNDWSQLMVETFSVEDFITITGAGASWKTTSLAIFALTAWYSSPHDTVVILTSTTLPGLRRRVWKEVMRYWRIQPCMGHPIQSRDCIQWRKGSDDAGIFGIACETGEINKAVGKIIGFHAPNIIVGVDEMPYTSEAIIEATTNLKSGSTRFKFIGLGNADDRLDPHGRYCEPVNGWDSITPESREWRTRRGICLHLDALEAPNVKAGKILFPGMINQQDIDSTIHDYGEDSPQFWQQRRGFWAPEGMSRTVLSASIITKFQAKDKVIWNTDYHMGAGLDPAFTEGGDRIVLRIGKCGRDDRDKMVLSLAETILIPVIASSTEPIHYQIVRQVRETCISKGIEPNMFALDSTGEGGGLASIFQREWSPEILCVEFGGRPSKRPVSSTNAKPADQEYFNRVTELWFQFRLLVMNGQIRDLDHDTAAELCQRRVLQKGNLTQVETKATLKERTKRSCDLADATVVLSELFLTRLSDFRHTSEAHDPDVRFRNWREMVSAEIDEEYYATAALDDEP